MSDDMTKLRDLIGKATDSDLSDGGRYFAESCTDLTQCGHGDTGEYRHRPDGKLVEFLWNNRRLFLELLEAAQIAHSMLRQYDGSPSNCGDAFKVLDVVMNALGSSRIDPPRPK